MLASHILVGLLSSPTTRVKLTTLDSSPETLTETPLTLLAKRLSSCTRSLYADELAALASERWLTTVNGSVFPVKTSFVTIPGSKAMVYHLAL